MSARPLILAFLLSLFISILIDAGLLSIQNEYGYLANFLLMTYAVAGSFLIHVILFAILWLLFFVINRKASDDKAFKSGIVIVAFFYFVAVLVIDWLLSRDIFASFSTYLYMGAHYPIHAFLLASISAFQILRAKKRSREHASAV